MHRRQATAPLTRHCRNSTLHAPSSQGGYAGEPEVGMKPPSRFLPATEASNPLGVRPRPLPSTSCAEPHAESNPCGTLHHSQHPPDGPASLAGRGWCEPRQMLPTPESPFRGLRGSGARPPSFPPGSTLSLGLDARQSSAAGVLRRASPVVLPASPKWEGKMSARSSPRVKQPGYGVRKSGQLARWARCAGAGKKVSDGAERKPYYPSAPVKIRSNSPVIHVNSRIPDQ